MIATRDFVFLHLHKSGGTFVNEMLLRFVPGAQAIGYHLPRSMLPPEHRGKPVLGLVRNPWSYYVSWYAFQTSLPRQNALFSALSANGTHGFEQTIFNMLRLESDEVLLRQVCAALPAQYTGAGLNLPGPALAPILGSGLGFYGFLCQYMYGAPDALVRIGKMETLRHDIASLLTGAGCSISIEMQKFLADAAPRNVSRHAPFQSFYGPELRRLVAVRDASLIAAHQYRFEN